jgi:hypothetical protein
VTAVTEAQRAEIEKRIVECLSPHKLGESDVTNGVRHCAETLQARIDRISEIPTRLAARRAGAKLGAKATGIRKAVDRLPADVKAEFALVGGSFALDQLNAACAMMATSRAYALWPQEYDDEEKLGGVADFQPGQDRDKLICAVAALELVEKYSVNPATTTDDGLFRAIASLLFEIFSGKKDMELKRACDRVLVWSRKVRDLTKRPGVRTC